MIIGNIENDLALSSAAHLVVRASQVQSTSALGTAVLSQATLRTEGALPGACEGALG